MADKTGLARKTAAPEKRPVVMAKANPAALGARPPLARSMQQRAGNAAMQAIVARATNANAGSAGLSISRPGDAHEREAETMADTVMRMAVPASAQPLPPARAGVPAASAVQRRCSKCDEEAKELNVQRSESTADAPQVTPAIANSISALRGGGSPLPEPTRAMFEPRFGADFSRVRIHTDSQAARTASSINARAFTVGPDIAFASGQYSPHSGEGQHLLAHELTHVIQQGSAGSREIHRDPDPQAQPPAPDIAAPSFNPEGVVQQLLYLLQLDDFGGVAQEIDDDAEAEVIDAQEQFQRELDYATAWAGNGPGAARKILLLQSEDFRLQNDPAYKASVIDKFGAEQYPEDEYLESLLDTYDPLSQTEEAALGKLKANLLGRNITPSNFVDDPDIQRWDGGNAFPRYAWNILYPLISPSNGVRESVTASLRATQDSLVQSWSDLGFDLYENGVPASYARSLNLTEYSTIKTKAIPKLLKLPDRPWFYEQFVSPEEVQLHTSVMKTYTGNLTGFALASLQKPILDKWIESTSFNWNAFDAYAISSFRLTHPSGMGSVEDFFNYAQKGVGLGASLMALKAKAQVQSSGLNPFLFLARISTEAQQIAPTLISKLNAAELQNFKNVLAHADSKIAGLTPAIRLMTAIEWSVRKGFAGDAIWALLQNVDEILVEILKEMAKDKVIKEAIATGVGMFGPWGRAISLIYRLWTFLDDVSDKIELAMLIKSFIDTLDEAKNAQSVVKIQRSSAQLAQVFESTFQRLIQKLGGKLVGKLSVATATRLKEGRKKGERMGDAERTNLLEQSRNEPNAKKLKPEQVEAEFQTAIKSPVTVSADAIVIQLPNGHTWKREKGAKGWCRASPDCVTDFLNPEITNELDFITSRHLPDDFEYRDYPSLLDHKLRHQTSRGNFGEVMSDRMVNKAGYQSMGGLTHPENADRGPGIDNVWRPKKNQHFDYTVSETKFVTGFDGDLRSVKLGRSKSGLQLSDSWIMGRDFNTMKKRLEAIVGPKKAEDLRDAIDKNRVERLLIVVNETGKTWVYEVSNDGTSIRERAD